MRGITEEFVREFRNRRKDWDIYQIRDWMKSEEAGLKEENPGLYDYITAVIHGLGERLDASISPLICDRLYLHFLELLAIAREYEQIEGLEDLWEK